MAPTRLLEHTSAFPQWREFWQAEGDGEVEKQAESVDAPDQPFASRECVDADQQVRVHRKRRTEKQRHRHCEFEKPLQDRRSEEN